MTVSPGIIEPNITIDRMVYIPVGMNDQASGIKEIQVYNQPESLEFTRSQSFCPQYKGYTDDSPTRNELTTYIPEEGSKGMKFN